MMYALIWLQSVSVCLFSLGILLWIRLIVSLRKMSQ